MRGLRSQRAGPAKSRRALLPTLRPRHYHFCNPYVTNGRDVLASASRLLEANSLAPDSSDAIAFCLDSIVDLTYMTVSVAYDAAASLWPDRVVGPLQLYVDKARPILPVLAEPHQAVVLVRLLADEGVIGARSTAGREGPVVGRAVRHSGSRPLLVAEIAEHWPVVMDSCLLRWSLEEQQQHQQQQQEQQEQQEQQQQQQQQEGHRESKARPAGPRRAGGGGVAGARRDELLARARVAFRAAQVAMMEDESAVAACLERVSPHVTAVEALKGCSRSAALLLTSTLPAPLGLRVMQRCGLAAAAPSAAAVPGTAAEGAMVAGKAAAVVEQWPGDGALQLVPVFEPSWFELVARVVGTAEAARAKTAGGGRGAGGVAGRVGGGPAVGAGRVQLVTGNLARLEQLVEEGAWERAMQRAGMGGVEVALPRGEAGDVRAEAGAAVDAWSGEMAMAGSRSGSGRRNIAGAAAGAQDAGVSAASSEQSSPPLAAGRGSSRPALQPQAQGHPSISRHTTSPSPAAADGGAAIIASGGGASSSAATGGGAVGSCGLWDTLRTVHLAEWSCSSMSFRARALSHSPRATLLGEHQLAELLGVQHLTVVMDGVAWR